MEKLSSSLLITVATEDEITSIKARILSRFLNRNFELLEPYEGKLSRTVLRGGSGSNAADLLDSIDKWKFQIALQKNEMSYAVSLKAGICNLFDGQSEFIKVVKDNNRMLAI